MAGGKETPRQKMIGMMYLVLTCLLALNVSSSVIDKFVTINLALEHSVEAAKEQNSNTMRGIQKQVEDKGSRPADVKVLDQAKKIREKTSSVIDKLEDYKKKFVEITGGTNENGQLVGKTNYDKVGYYMMPEGEGHGVELQKELNSYADFLNSTINPDTKFQKLAMDAAEDPYYSKDPNQEGKDWSELMFESTPTPAGMATLSQMQAKIMQDETRALDILAKRVGAKDISFDQIDVVALPESRVVAAGAKYKADLFVSASSSAENPDMMVNGKPIPVESGKGQVEFVATPGDYDNEGLAKKTYDAAIKLKDSVYSKKIEYFVAKPVIQVQSAALSALYLNCGNELNVQVPALGNSYNPSFSASGASTYEGSQKGLVTVVPNAPKVKLNVTSNGNSIGSVDFSVKRIPKPSIEVYNGSKKVNEKQGEMASRFRVIRIQAEAEENFKKLLPKDARYRVSRWTITLARGPRPVGAPIRATSETVNLSNIMNQAKSGDRLVIEVNQVQRMNFRGKVEEVNIGSFTKSIPLN